MIGVKGQYVAMFKIGDFKDFIGPRDLIQFKIIEEAGNVMPTYELVFECRDEQIVSVLKEGNFIYASFGRNEASMINVKLAILKRQKTNFGVGSQILRVLGVFGAVPYRIDSQAASHTGTSIEVMKSIVSKYFKADFNCPASDNKMNWLQNNINDRDFVNQLWLHSNLNSDTPLVGITTDGLFRVRSISTAVDRNNPNWKLTSLETKDAGAIYYDKPPNIYSDSGAVNALGGYAKSRIVHNQSDNQSFYSTPQGSPILSVSSNQEVSDTGRRLGGVSILNENVHSSYHSSFDYNVRNLLRLSMMKAKVEITGYYFNIRVLDSVLLKEDSDARRKEANMDSSGLWLTQKVCRIFTNKDLCTVLTLCRDGMNNSREV
ncbi:hypothetical protein [Escherichia phage EP_H11]|nr:hypothetical protein [Escherichia phage EP_H11]